MRRPLEKEMVRRGLASDTGEARRLITSGRVIVSGASADNPARQVDASEPVSVEREARRFVSRGGDKLWGAMEEFDVVLDGARVLDAGASTGGFTDVVLQRGASSVVATDVGRGQLHERLRQDPRVTVRDRVNLRLVDPGELGSFDWVVGDLSFISLDAVIDTLLAICEPGGHLMLLVKPQFEASHEVVSAGHGVVTDPDAWTQALADAVDSAIAAGAEVLGLSVSPIRGARGNVEFFLYMSKPHDPSHMSDLYHGAVPEHPGMLVDRAVARALELFGDPPRTRGRD